MATAQRQCPDIVSMRTSPTIQVIYKLVNGVHSWATFPPVFSDRLYRQHFVPRSFVPSMKCTIQGSKRRHAWCLPPFAGPTWGGTLPQPPAAAWAAKEEKFTSTFICNQSRFQFHSGGLRTFTLILLVRCLGRQVFLTFLRS
jgi:hypothetical protein